MTNRKIIILLSLCSLLFLCGYLSRSSKTETAYDSWGTFTLDKTFSYDEKYYAVQEVEEEPYLDSYVSYIEVYIYETETDTPVFSFCPARARDFWGICWEKDTYNIWTQSADVGIYCYKYEDAQWVRDESAVRPEYIISKYDKNMKTGE